MSKIKVLPELLVNKIAAGEVIERPASVVKELIENAIDAGAHRISVAIEDGGKKLIRVTDDGEGMNADDLRLAVTPHATSKIVDENDLFQIATMGFRGEALPSIGSVSQLQISSRPASSIEGAQITVAAKRIESSGAAGRPVGTSVEVRDLFFNVPARRKFLKSTATEVGHINEQFARLALAHRSIAFELTNNGRAVHRLTPAETALERIAALYGKDLAQALIPIERQEQDLHIEALVAPPAQSRSSASWQYFFLNGRFIRDRFIQHAVREAYRGLMEHTRYPVVFLFLTINPATVDVNVHPTKIEVRWQNSNLIHSQVLAALREKFLTTDLTPSLRTQGSIPAEAAAAEVRQQAVDFFRSAAPIQPSAPAWGEGNEDRRSVPRGGTPTVLGSRGILPREVGPEVWDTVYGRGGLPERPPSDAVPSEAAPGSPPSDFAADTPRRAIQLHNTYLVTETSDGMLIIDQHALHERIMYEKLKGRIVHGPLESQRLLLPETLSATSEMLAILADSQPLLERMGIEAGPFGEDAIAIHAFPAILKDIDPAAFLRDLLDKLAEKGEQTHTEEAIHAVLDMMACKAAVKAGDPLTLEEIDTLISQKELVEKSSNCPHGRPTTLRLSIRDLERQFKRK